MSNEAKTTAEPAEMKVHPDAVPWQATIGFIGVGTINAACLRGLATCSTPLKKAVLSPRGKAKGEELLKELGPELVTIAASNQAVLDACDWVFIATPPGQVPADLCFRDTHVIVSLISGVSQDNLRAACAPATCVVQALPLPPAAAHKSTTVMCPKCDPVEALFNELGVAVPVANFKDSMKIAAMSCVMGDFYAHLRTCHEWLIEQGIEPATASSAVGGYFNTFNHDSLAAGPRGFDHLVAEQTPGGMNEGVISDLTRMGNYDNMKTALNNLLPKLLG